MPLEGHEGETITKGLDTLEASCQQYYRQDTNSFLAAHGIVMQKPCSCFCSFIRQSAFLRHEPLCLLACMHYLWLNLQQAYCCHIAQCALHTM